MTAPDKPPPAGSRGGDAKAPARAPLNLVMNRPDTDALKRVAGSNRDQVNMEVIDAACRATWHPPGQSAEDQGRRYEATVLAMMSFRPTDEIEGMLVAQAVAMHAATMECSRRAMLAEQPEEIGHAYRKSAANASRTFCELLSALDRKRGKGAQQSVRVEHVHVNSGAQAIIGNVGPGGGGGGQEKREQPRAAPPGLAHDAALGAVVPPLRRENEERATVPIAGDAKRKVPDARRQKHRPANR